jgi:TetR/AcrR family fatty acid metabolism transcriptional regulator
MSAAATVFAGQGYHHTTVADVARAAGVAPGTIYLYFSQKEDLLVSLYERSFRDFLVETHRACSASPPGVPRLRTLIRRHLDHARDNPELARVLHLHAREIQPRLRKGIAATIRPYADLIEEIIRDGKEAGVFDPEIPDAVARRFLLGGLDAFVTDSVLNDEPTPLDSVVHEACTLAARALGAPSAGEDPAAPDTDPRKER